MSTRREFIGLLGGAAMWPVSAGAQQSSPLPIVGYLSQSTQQGGAALIGALRQGLDEVGMVEGKHFASELRWANNDVDRLPELASDLVHRQVAAIVALNTSLTARAAKAASTDIPIVFVTGSDPVQSGLVTRLSRPGGNITGISTMNLELGSKWVNLLQELLPTIKRIAVLVNLISTDSARSLISSIQTATLPAGLQTEFVFANNEGEIEAAFDGLGARSQAMIIHPDILFLQNRAKVAALAVHERLPSLSVIPDFAKAGGMMSYGSNFIDAHRQAGRYVGRILRGEKPGDLPVQQATRFDFTINLRTARALGLDVPPMLLARADEVIE